MPDTPGRRLLDALQRELVQGLHDAVSEVAGDLAGLDVDDAFEGTAFSGKALAPVEVDNPVLAAFSRLLTNEDVAGTSARLRGWRDEAAEGAPRGVAYVVAGGGLAVVGLSIVPAAGPRLVLHAAGFAAGQSVDVALGDGSTLRISCTIAADEIEVAFFPDQAPAVVKLAVGDRVEVGFTSAGDSLVGIEGGPSVRLGSVSAGGWVAATPDRPFDRGGHLRFDGGQVDLAPAFLASLLSTDLSFPLDLDLRTTADTGVVLAGNPSLRTRLAGSGEGNWLDLEVGVVDEGGDPVLDVRFLTSVEVSLPGAPVSIHVDGLGLSMPVSLGLGTPLLPDAAAVQGLEPQGAGVSLDLPVVSGSGILARVGDDLAGALSVSIPPLSASAFGLLSPARERDPLSFLVIMGATFPPPGVQVGFGFAISGVGGVVGINRRIDRGALLRAVADGSAAQLLFPSDPAGVGPEAIHALPALFPPARGSVIAGPMFQLSWGGRVVTLSVAVLVEASTQVRMTIMGKLVVALPDPEAPLVFLQATFAGIIDPAEPSAMFVASLTGSHIVGAPLEGDILLLTRGGPDPTLVLSAGGFHPSYRVPRGVPPLKRMSMDLCPAPWIDLRCENYFAMTSNTMQLGARLELVAEVAGCGLRGWLGFDALIQHSPFRFVADMSGGIALRVLGETLVGISLALHLEGPAPYLARGRGSIDLFLFEVSFDFEIGWGSPAPPLAAAPDVGAELRKALAEPAAWRSRGSAPPGLALTGAAQQMLSDAEVVDPFGTISVRQERVPLGIDIQRFNALSVPPQRWDISEARFAADEPAAGQVEIRAQFAPGQFLAGRTDDQALTAPAFLQLKSGVEISPAPATGADARPAAFTWEERVVSRNIPMPERSPAGQFVDLGLVEVLVSALSLDDSGWWVEPEEIVTVEPEPPCATAFSWSMAPGPELPSVTELEVAQVVGAGELMVVEQWEIAD